MANVFDELKNSKSPARSNIPFDPKGNVWDYLKKGGDPSKIQMPAEKPPSLPTPPVSKKSAPGFFGSIYNASKSFMDIEQNLIGKGADMLAGTIGITHEELRSPSFLWSTAKEIPSSILGVVGQTALHPIQSAQSLLGGAARALMDDVQTIVINNFVDPKDREEKMKKATEIIDKYFSPPKTILTPGAQVAGSMLPYIIAESEFGLPGEVVLFAGMGQAQLPREASIRERADELAKDMALLGLFKVGSFAYDAIKARAFGEATKIAPKEPTTQQPARIPVEDLSPKESDIKVNIVDKVQTPKGDVVDTPKVAETVGVSAPFDASPHETYSKFRDTLIDPEGLALRFPDEPNIVDRVSSGEFNPVPSLESALKTRKESLAASEELLKKYKSGTISATPEQVQKNIESLTKAIAATNQSIEGLTRTIEGNKIAQNILSKGSSLEDYFKRQKGIPVKGEGAAVVPRPKVVPEMDVYKQKFIADPSYTTDKLMADYVAKSQGIDVSEAGKILNGDYGQPRRNEARNLVENAFKKEYGSSIGDVLQSWEHEANQELFNQAEAEDALRSNEEKDTIMLKSELIPGLTDVIGKDVLPFAKRLWGSVQDVYRKFVPTSASKEAQRAADIISKYKSTIANFDDLMISKLKETERLFDRIPHEERISDLANYERTGEFTTAPKGFSKMFKDMMNESWDMLVQAYGEDRVGFVENYFRRAYKFGSNVDEARGDAFLKEYQKSLAPTKSPLKGRKLKMPIDEALSKMRDAGIKVDLAESNPVTLMRWSMSNAKRALLFRKAWSTLKDEGLISFVRLGKRIPEGMVRLNDNVAKVFFHGEEGLVKAGEYWADENVARILNNAVSTGFENSSLYKIARGLENNINMFNLGLSAFHLTGTALNANISDLALVARQLIHGDVKGGMSHIHEALIPGAAGMDYFLKGKKFREDVKNFDPVALKVLDEVVNPAGGRINMDSRYRVQGYETLSKAIRQGEYLRAALHLPQALVERTGGLIMEHVVPNVKMGAFLSLSEDVLKSLPEDVSDSVKERALRSAWDSIDNRFGQLVYDNLFWDKTLKDTSMLAIRSVGWNLGTVREIGGGIKDVWSKGIKEGVVSDRTLYTAMLPLYVGLIGGIVHYINTGRHPQELSDYFYPGDGRGGRLSLPTYMRDVYGYLTDPLATVRNKESPILDMGLALFTNKNYLGDLVRNPDDPVSLQLQQVGSFVMNEYYPFSITQMKRLIEQGVPADVAFEDFMGITPAPASISKSKRQSAIEEELRKTRGGFAPRTPEQVDVTNLKASARRELEKGNRTSLDKLIRMGVFKTRKSLNDFLATVGTTVEEREFKALSKEEKLKILEEFPQ